MVPLQLRRAAAPARGRVAVAVEPIFFSAAVRERPVPARRPRVMALIPAYNPRAGELAQTLRSILDQTAPVDICLVDDGSTPPVQVPEFARARTRLLRLDRNGGITAALQRGVEFAEHHGYEFICRLDVGDWSYPTRVARQLAFMDAHPQTHLVGAFARVVDQRGEALFLHGVRGGPAAVAAYLRKNSPFKHSTFFMRTAPVAASGGYSMAFDGAEDYELLLRLAASGEVDCLPDTLIDYVVDPAGISERRRGRQLRKRLAAQLRHLAPFSPGAWAGVLRTLALILTPRSLALRASLWTWRRGAPAARRPSAAAAVSRGPRPHSPARLARSRRAAPRPRR
jgi:GT2 family glycosyltransferase